MCMFNRRGFWRTKAALGTRVHPVLSSQAVRSPIIDDEAWLAELSCTNAKGATLGNTQGGTMCENEETTSMSTDLSSEVLPPCKKSGTSSWMRQSTRKR
eukprot:5736345-Amphidinium_carterae.1